MLLGTFTLSIVLCDVSNYCWDKPHLYNDIPVNYLRCLYCNCVELVSRSIWVKPPPVSLQSWYHCSHCISQTFDRRFLATNFGCNQCFYKNQVRGKFPGIFWWKKSSRNILENAPRLLLKVLHQAWPSTNANSSSADIFKKKSSCAADIFNKLFCWYLKKLFCWYL